MATEVGDSWGNNLRMEPVQWNKAYYVVRSAGPDKQFNTGDDLATYLEIHHRKIVGRKSSGRGKRSQQTQTRH